MPKASRITLAGVVVLAGLSLQPAKAEVCETVRIGGQFNDWIRYCASSVLPPQAGNTYGPANLSFAGPRDQAWCEGRNHDGTGEYVTVEFDRPAYFRTVIIENGYQKTAASFRNNARVQHVTLEVEGGARWQFQLQDAMGQQRFALPTAIEARWLRLTIDSIYPAARWPDTCISLLSVDQEELNYR
jgi:hypothetical protein